MKLHALVCKAAAETTPETPEKLKVWVKHLQKVKTKLHLTVHLKALERSWFHFCH